MIDTRHTWSAPTGIDRTLAAAAFGDRPGSWPLPTATTPDQLWLRAVACGGQGRYGAAYRDLATLRRGGRGRLVSLAHSTQGSFLRQLGWHAVARGWDGRALALAGTDPEARADALIGLAADALGVGRFAAAATLLARADRRADDRAGAGPASGAPGMGGRRAGDGVRRRARRRAARHRGRGAGAGDGPVASARHRVKSDVVLAAALCSAGDTGPAREVAQAALEDTGRLGLLPLRWALACLLIDIGSVTFSPREAAGNSGYLRRPGAPRRWDVALRLKRHSGRYCQLS